MQEWEQDRAKIIRQVGREKEGKVLLRERRQDEKREKEEMKGKGFLIKRLSEKNMIWEREGTR